MKRFVVAGLFIVVGFIILGVATANLMSGPDKPKEKHPVHGSAAGDTHKAAQHGAGADGNVLQPQLPSTKPTQPTAANGAPPQGQMPGMAPLPGMPLSLTTVQPTLPHPPPPQTPQHVPIIQPTDIGTPTSPTAGRQHQ
ncbi:MAG TPA: hypothetical protein VFQ90_17915 [Stellaceae bacterium]|jgi:hypothetical protein|nr:hypothetical protein [Stellaceae bacterium]